MAPTKKNDAFCMELTILERIPRHREPATWRIQPHLRHHHPTVAHPTVAHPTVAHPTAAYPTYVLLSDANNQLSSSLAYKATNFWLFLTIILVFLVAFYYIYTMYT